jgi:2'-5' RNA ligase
MNSSEIVSKILEAEHEEFDPREFVKTAANRESAVEIYNGPLVRVIQPLSVFTINNYVQREWDASYFQSVEAQGPVYLAVDKTDHDNFVLFQPSTNKAWNSEGLEQDFKSIPELIRSERPASKWETGSAATEDKNWLDLQQGLATFFMAQIAKKKNVGQWVKFLTMIGRTDLATNYARYLGRAKLPFGKSIDAVMAMKKAGKRSRNRIARLMKNQKDVKWGEQGFWLLFDDWSDLAPFYGESRNYDYAANAEKIFGGDTFEWFDGAQHDPEDGWDEISDANLAVIKQLLVHRTVYNSDGEEHLVTKQDIEELTDDEIKDIVCDRGNKHDSCEDIHDAIRHAMDDAYRSQQEAAYFEGYRSALMKEWGLQEDKTIKWVNVGKRTPDKKNDDGTVSLGHQKQMLGIWFPYKTLEEWIEKWKADEYEDDYYGDIHDLAKAYLEKITPSEEYWGDTDTEYFNERLKEQLGEIDPQEAPEAELPPGQQELPLQGEPPRQTTEVDMPQTVTVGEHPETKVYKGVPRSDAEKYKKAMEPREDIRFRAESFLSESIPLADNDQVDPKEFVSDRVAAPTHYVIRREWEPGNFGYLANYGNNFGWTHEAENAFKFKTPEIADKHLNNIGDPDALSLTVFPVYPVAESDYVDPKEFTGKHGGAINREYSIDEVTAWVSKHSGIDLVGLGYKLISAPPEGGDGTYTWRAPDSDKLAKAVMADGKVLKAGYGWPNDFAQFGFEESINEKAGDKKIEFEATPDAAASLVPLLKELRKMGDQGSSRDITIDDWDGKSNFGFDGDGNAKIGDIKVDGQVVEGAKDVALRTAVPAWVIQRSWGEDKGVSYYCTEDTPGYSGNYVDSQHDAAQLPLPEAEALLATVLDRIYEPNDPERENWTLVPYYGVNESEEAIMEAVYKLSTTQIDIPKDIAQHIISWGELNIADEDLYIDEKDGCGRETEQHVTVLYGLTDGTPSEELTQIVKSTKPFLIEFAGVSVFENPKYDVIKLDVISEELHNLHSQLRKACPNENKFPDYKPHCTVAYVQKGKGKKYAGQDAFKAATVARDFWAYDLKFKGAGDSEDGERVVDLISFDKSKDIEREEPEAGEQRFPQATREGQMPDPTEDDLAPYVATEECYDCAGGVQKHWPHLQLESGFYIKDDGTPADHGWCISPSGTIFDTTSGQFGGTDIILPPGHPNHTRYVSYEREFERAKELEAKWEQIGHENSKRVSEATREEPELAVAESTPVFVDAKAFLDQHAPLGCPSCHSHNLSKEDEEGLVDCMDCGIWFDPLHPENQPVAESNDRDPDRRWKGVTKQTDELAKTDPHAATVMAGGGTLIRPPLPSREKWNAMLAAYAPGCGSPTPYPGTGSTVPCGSTVEGKQFLCHYCDLPAPVAESDEVDPKKFTERPGAVDPHPDWQVIDRAEDSNARIKVLYRHMHGRVFFKLINEFFGEDTPKTPLTNWSVYVYGGADGKDFMDGEDFQAATFDEAETTATNIAFEITHSTAPSYFQPAKPKRGRQQESDQVDPKEFLGTDQTHQFFDLYVPHHERPVMKRVPQADLNRRRHRIARDRGLSPRDITTMPSRVQEAEEINAKEFLNRTTNYRVRMGVGAMTRYLHQEVGTNALKWVDFDDASIFDSDVAAEMIDQIGDNYGGQPVVAELAESEIDTKALVAKVPHHELQQWNEAGPEGGYKCSCGQWRYKLTGWSSSIPHAMREFKAHKSQATKQPAQESAIDPKSVAMRVPNAFLIRRNGTSHGHVYYTGEGLLWDILPSRARVYSEDDAWLVMARLTRDDYMPNELDVVPVPIEVGESLPGPFEDDGLPGEVTSFLRKVRSKRSKKKRQPII